MPIDPTRLTDAERKVLTAALTDYEYLLANVLADNRAGDIRRDATWRSFVAQALREQIASG